MSKNKAKKRKRERGKATRLCGGDYSFPFTLWFIISPPYTPHIYICIYSPPSLCLSLSFFLSFNIHSPYFFPYLNTVFIYLEIPTTKINWQYFITRPFTWIQMTSHFNLLSIIPSLKTVSIESVYITCAYNLFRKHQQRQGIQRQRPCQ